MDYISPESSNLSAAEATAAWYHALMSDAAELQLQHSRQDLDEGSRAVRAARKLVRMARNESGPRRPDTIALRRFAGPDVHAEQLSHLRVVHLTDMHFGRVTPARVQERAVALTNAEQPDLVVITGDFVCHSQMYLDQMMATLAKVDAPIIGVLGNHDYWSGHNEVARALTRIGAEVLRNRHTIISLRHERLQVVGVDDAYTGHADSHRATQGLRKDLPVLGLSHIAEEADALWHYGVPLVLSGHTHAGQVTLARIHEFALGRVAGHRYVHGLYGERRSDGHVPTGAVYVGAGIGASVVPVRIGERARREVAVFELGREVGSIDEHHAEQEPLKGRSPNARKVAQRQRAVWKKAARRNGRSPSLRNGTDG